MSKTFEFEADPFSVLDMWGSTSMILAVKLPGECDEFTRYRVTLTPVEQEPECEPEPLCPVCGKLASEHWDGLWTAPVERYWQPRTECCHGTAVYIAPYVGRELR